MHSRTESRWVTPALALALASCGTNPSTSQTGPNAAPSATGSGASSSGGSPGGSASSGASSGGVSGGSSSGTSSGGGGSTGAGSSGSGSGSGTPPAQGGPDASTQPDATTPLGDGSAPAPTDAQGGTGSSDAPYDAGPPAVRYVARVDYTDATGPRFAWSGSTVLARFTGSSIGVKLSGPTTYFDVSIDGVMQSTTLMIASGTTSYPLATNLAAGPHELTVYRRNEPGIGGTGDTTFLGLILDPAGGTLLPPSEPSARRIEIVGDSITSGFGDESVNGACPNQLEAQNYDVAYGAVAARAVGADLITIAWTGKGMYRNNDGTLTDTMPIYYGRTLPDQTTDTWNFASWIPQAVVIYLGNNDFGKGDPGQEYVTTYNTFLARVRKNYPSALIICTIGPNLTDPKLSEERTYVQGIVTAMNTAGDMNVVFLEMPQPTAAEGTGCGGHPLAATHARMGAALAAELQTKLGW